MGPFLLLGVLSAAATLSAAAPATSPQDPLANVQKVVLFMQENRAFDHYYGVMAGVAGFSDPNARSAASTGKTTFHQPVDGSVQPPPPAGISTLLPFHINAQGGNAEDAFQCMTAGSNGWAQNHAYWNKGQLDRAAKNLTAYSLGYYKRQDLPFHYALADAYTIGDAYHESVIAETNPNRASWASATNGIAQSRKAGAGGPVVSNDESSGQCHKSPDHDYEFTCYPFNWKTVPEYLQDAGITWQVFQDEDNFDDNPFQWFKAFQDAPPGSPLADRGLARNGLQTFYDAAKAGTLPQVSFVIGPTDLSEHPPYGPLDGAWLQQQVVEAVVNGAEYNSTALIISYDETGGFADHVISPLPPANTDGEYITDIYNASLGIVPNGPGFRVPLTIISPWTRGGKVFTERSAHESQVLFLEKWAAAIGKPFTSQEMVPWRRQQLSDLVKAFDFSRKDTGIPSLPQIRAPSQDPITGEYNGGATCQAKYPDHQPNVPYGKQTEADALAVEKGFKQLVGNPTEGRYLVFEAFGLALSYDAQATHLAVQKASADHSGPNIRFILHAVNDTPNNNVFTIQTATSNPQRYISSTLQLVDNVQQAGQFSITDRGNGAGYEIKEQRTQHGFALSSAAGQLSLQSVPISFSVFSVTG